MSYRIFTECFGYKMYVSTVGNGWTDRPDEATVFGKEPPQTQGHRLTWFTALIGSVVDGATCAAEMI